MATKTERDYSLCGLNGLNTEEKIKEVSEPKESYNAVLFKCDMDKARRLNVNMARILRFKFHEWLEEKFPDQ
jgi:hypothetical protein